MGAVAWLRRGIRRVRGCDEGIPDDPRDLVSPVEVQPGHATGAWRGVIEGVLPQRRVRAADPDHGLSTAAPDTAMDADPDLPLLSQPQAVWLRRLTRQALAEGGLECTVTGTAAVDADGTVYRLWHLAAVCRDRPERDWPALVREHVAATLHGARRPHSVADALRSATLRLANVDSLPDVHRLAHVRAVAPGLVEVLALDYPQAVIIPDADEITAQAPAAGLVADLVSAARARLLEQIRGDLSAVTVRTREGLSFTAVQSRSMAVAALALALDDLVADLEPDLHAPNGFFVAVPNRHQLAYRPVVGLSSLLSVQPLAGFAYARHEAGVDPLSPHVYWVREGRWHQLTHPRGERVAIHLSTELTDAIGEDGAD